MIRSVFVSMMLVKREAFMLHQREPAELPSACVLDDYEMSVGLNGSSARRQRQKCDSVVTDSDSDGLDGRMVVLPSCSGRYRSRSVTQLSRGADKPVSVLCELALISNSIKPGLKAEHQHFCLW